MSERPASSFEAAFERRPNLFERWQRFESLLWEAPGAQPDVYALCRRRLAQLNGAAVLPGSAGPALTPARCDELETWWRSDAFDPLERACLGFAEQFALDPGGIDDELARPVVEALGDAGMVAFVEALAIFDGFTRFCAMLDLAGAAGERRSPGGAPT